MGRRSEARSCRRICRGHRYRSRQQRRLCAGRSERAGAARDRWPPAIGIRSSFPSADVLRGRDEDDRAFRACSWDERRSGRRTAVKKAPAIPKTMFRGCGSIRTPCGSRTRSTARRRRPCCFGYFSTTAKDGRNTPGTTVFSCLSHDIIAHETTHALLDGVHPRFNEPVNEDVLAFHEAFADIVALFQHFSYPGVLRDQIARTRGDLARQSVLGTAGAAVCLGVGTRRRAAQLSRKDGERQMEADQAGSDAARGRPPSRMTAARSWLRRSSAPSRRSTRRARATFSASPPKAPACCARATSIPTS